MRRALASLRTTGGIVVPLVLALGGATAAALAPASSQEFDVAAAPSESYALAAATFAPVSASGFRGSDDTPHSTPAPETKATDGPSTSEGTPATAERPELTLRMSADREKAQPGQEITYTVVVGNVGTVDASNVVAESHVPAGTSMDDGAGCVSGTAASPCVPIDGQGNGDTSAAHISHVFGPLAPGAVVVWRFRVKVNVNTPVTTVIRNHAHMRATDFDTVTSTEVSVTVQ